ncbi:BTAD domain-containing putative transcriptional regulator [Actinosynnema sp. NPDC023794]
MHDLLRGRLSVVVAAAGYGKTTAVRQWLRDTGEQALVVDDVSADHLPSPQRRPDRLVLLSRRPIPVAALLRYDLGAPIEIGPRQLALSPRQVAVLLAGQYGVDNPDTAASVHALTAGWPALVHLAAAHVVAAGVSEPSTDLLSQPDNPLYDYVCAEVLDDLTPDALELLAHLSVVGAVSAELTADIGEGGLGAQIGLLARLGLLLPENGWHQAVPLIAAIAEARHPMPPMRRAAFVALAADWHRDHDRLVDALRLATAAGDQTRCADLLRDHGADLLATGAGSGIVAAAAVLPDVLRDPAIDLVHADALQATGRTRAAVAAYARLTGGADSLPPGLAWRYGAALYLWGDPNDALAVLRRGRSGGDSDPDTALLLAWTSAAHWLAGDEAECTAFAGKAVEAARATGDQRALAAAHVALALCADLTGDPVGLRAHYSRALEFAEAAGDTAQVLRIRVNLAAGLEQEGRLIEALAVLHPAVDLARSAGYDSSLALALANQGSLLHSLGRLDEALAGYHEAVRVYERMHSMKVAYPLTGLGDVHRLRGQPAQAKASYTEALRAAVRDGHHRQSMVPALCGLARVAAATDQEEAAVLADRAVEHAHGRWVTTALVARAWVAWQRGASDDVRRDARAAAEVAAVHRDRGGLARALEVEAAATDDPAAARELLREALSIWTESQAVLEADRIRVALGRIAGDNGDLRLNGRLAESRLAAAGVADTPPTRPGAPRRVEIRVLGGFTVLVDGRRLPARAWQSRKARDLLRVLVARRGAPVPREELADLLWGRTAPAERQKVAHRLAVALSTLRAVLDPDRLGPVDHFVLSSQKDIAVDLGMLDVDVEDLFAQAQYGVRLQERGEFADAWAVLTAADRAYTGEVFADDPYTDWARPLREEARAAHLRILRTLVDLARRAGEVDDVVHYLLRILSVDPFDEQSHRDLVANLSEAGRHGEASRAFNRYAEAMREIGVLPREVLGVTRHPAR